MRALESCYQFWVYAIRAADRHLNRVKDKPTSKDGTPPSNEQCLIHQILRFRSKDGTARVEVNPTDDVSVISFKVQCSTTKADMLVIRNMENRGSTVLCHCERTISSTSRKTSAFSIKWKTCSRFRSAVGTLEVITYN